MKIVDKTKEPVKPATTLNSIPVGQVFRGTITSISSGNRYPGIFYKAYGPVAITTMRGSTAGKQADVVVVRLDSQDVGYSQANIFTFCTPVENYEALDVELCILPKKV
jgi:hypothetical protein